MKQTLQIISDTNILVAAFRSKRGAANLLLDKLDDSRWQVNVSTALLLEYEDVLKRPEMNRKEQLCDFRQMEAAEGVHDLKIHM